MNDPLLDAVIGKLPQAGKSWSAEGRAAWLKMMAMAFDLVYGAEAEIDVTGLIGKEPEPVEPAAAKPGATTYDESDAPKLRYAFYVDGVGFARAEDGRRIMPNQVIGTLFDTRGEAGDLGAIKWADGSTGVRGRQLEISAA